MKASRIDDAFFLSSASVEGKCTNFDLTISSSGFGCQDPEDRAHEIRIFDNVGRLMLQVPGNGQSTAIDLTGFTSGVYFISIDNGQVKKFIKI